MASNSYVDVRLEMNPCYEDHEAELNEKKPILNNQYSGTHYTEDDNLTETEDEKSLSIQSSISIQNHSQSTMSHLFAVSVVLIEISGACCLATVICWIVYFRDGLAWDGGEKEFNWHPIFMVAGMFCYANAALSSYVVRRYSESTTHYLHCLALILTFIFTIFGLVSSLSTHTILTAKFYSFHSWMGLITLALFVVQMIIGFIGLFPRCENPTRKKYLKFQVWICIVVLAFGIGTSLLGSTEKLRDSLASSLASFSYEGLLVNMFSLFLVFFGCLVCTVLLHPVYRAP